MTAGNGSAVTFSTDNFPSGWQLGNYDSGVNIGVESDALAGFFTGSVDDLRVYNRVLTADDVKGLYLATSHRPPGQTPRNEVKRTTWKLN